MYNIWYNFINYTEIFTLTIKFALIETFVYRMQTKICIIIERFEHLNQNLFNCNKIYTVEPIIPNFYICTLWGFLQWEHKRGDGIAAVGLVRMTKKE